MMNLDELIKELLPRLQYERIEDHSGSRNVYAKVDLDTFNLMLAIVHKAIDINDEVKSRI